MPDEKPFANAQTTPMSAAGRQLIEDMNHNNRVDAPLLPSYDLRHFCGFCGTHMTKWDEINRERASCIAISLGSINDDDVDLLSEIGLLPEIEDELVEQTQSPKHRLSAEVQHTNQGVSMENSGEINAKGTAWFESLIQDSRLGRLSKHRRSGTHEHNGVRVTWVVEELGPDEGDGEDMDDLQARAKRRRT